MVRTRAHENSEEEEEKMEVDDPQDSDENNGGGGRGDDEEFEDKIMQVMERALGDPDTNSTMKRIIDEEVKKRIRAIRDAERRGDNPDDADSDNDEGNDANQNAEDARAD